MTPPVITLFGNSKQYLTVGDTFIDSGASASDDVVAVEVFVTGTVDSSSIQTFVLTYTAVDSSGNQAQPKTRVVIVQAPADTNPPAITLLGAEFMEVDLGSTFQDPGATAVDAVDGVVDVVAAGSVNTASEGLYTITYTASDSAGNQAVPATRVVEVVEPVDDVAPVIVLNGSDYIELTVGDSYSDAGATATDNVDDTVNVTPSGSVDTTTGGFYAITYKATDSAGNDATPVVRVVYVGASSGAKSRRGSARVGGAPDITLLEDSSVNHPVGTDYTDAGATAADSGTDPDATVDVVTYGLSDVDTDVLGSLHDYLPQQIAMEIGPRLLSEQSPWSMKRHPRSFLMAMLPSVIQ